MAINDPNKWTDHVRREQFAAEVEAQEEAAKAARLAKIQSMKGKVAPTLLRKIDQQVGVRPEPSFKELLERRGK